MQRDTGPATEQRAADALLPMVVLGVVVALVAAGWARGWWWPNAHNGLLALAFGIPGAWTLVRRPRHREGLLLAAVGVVEAVVFLGRQTGHDATSDLARWAGWLGVWPVALVLALTTWTVLRFPEGRFLSEGWRRYGVAVAVVGVALSLVSALWPVEFDAAGDGLTPPFALPGADPARTVWSAVAHPVYLVLQVSWVIAVVDRWRSSNGPARRQLAVVAGAAALTAALLVVGLLVSGSPRLGLLATPLVPLAGWWAMERLGLARVVERTRAAGGLAGLSPRENDVLDLMAQGLSNQAIADRLHLSIKTVEPAVGAIFTKLGLPADPASNRRVLAVLAFVRR